MGWVKFGSTGPLPQALEVGTPAPTKIYVASSSRNEEQQKLVEVLRFVGFEVYDFKNPPNGEGPFEWSQVGLDRDGDVSSVADYLSAIRHPRAFEHFNTDFEAMQAADVFVLLLPCGRSAHLELGWAVGEGKQTAVLLDDPCTPELTYRMVDLVTDSISDLLGWLGVDD